MKKTMLKRSLALGALMAFVITDSAMAADRILLGKGTVNNNDDISITTSASYGIKGQFKDSVANLNGANISVNVDYDEGMAVGVNASAFSAKHGEAFGGGHTINLGNEKSNIDIAVSGNGTIGLWAYNENENPNNKSGGVLNVTAQNLNVSVNSTADWAYGVYAQNCTTKDSTKNDNVSILIINADNVTITSKAASGNSIGLIAMSSGKLTVNGNLTVNADEAIVARGNAVVKINEDGKHATKLNGDISFNYDATTSGTNVDADVIVNLTGSDSYWNGNTAVTWNRYDSKNNKFKDLTEEQVRVTNLKITLADGAQWNPLRVEEEGQLTGEVDKEGVRYNALNNLILNNGIVNLTGAEDQAIKVENISGEGTVIVNDTENKMQITEKNDLQKLNVTTTRDYAERLVQQYDMNDALQLIADQVSDETVDRTKDSAATDVEIVETDVTGLATANVKDGLVVLNTVKENVNTSNAGISNMGSIALMTWRQENNDMNKRLGELRDSSGEHGAWVRMTRGEGTYKSIKNQYNSYQIGYDEKLSSNKNWTVGAAFTYTDGESSFNKGTGENTHKGLALYGSYLGEDGSFVDLIAKYARLDHEFDVIGGAGKGDYDTNGYSISAEYGKRFTKESGLWIEPQVELTYGKVGSADYLTSNGVRVRQEGMDSFVGRLGFALGQNLANNKGNVYLRASYLYDFDGDTSMSFAKGNVSRTIEQDLGGGWWEVGLGTNINFSEAAHLYFDVEKTYGGDVATPWQWNAGVRWSF